MGDKHFLNEDGPDVVIQRDTFPPDPEHSEPWTLVRVNVPRTVVWHSPAGFDYGYNGSGPADLALNILQAFLPGRDVECYAGTKCSRAAAHLYQGFKDNFIAHLRGDRNLIPAGLIKGWIATSLPVEFHPEPAADEPKPEPIDDLRNLTRLTGDLLRLLGHRIGVGEPVRQDPLKAMVTLKKVDALLVRLEEELDLAPREPV